jgi:hypothetical protein
MRNTHHRRDIHNEAFWHGVMIGLPVSAILWGFIVLGICWSLL